MSKIREKESLECGRMHIWALKTQKWALAPGHNWLTSLTWHRYISNYRPQNLGPPLNQILDPHLWTMSSLHGIVALHDLHWNFLFSHQMISKQDIVLNHVFSDMKVISKFGPVTKNMHHWFCQIEPIR